MLNNLQKKKIQTIMPHSVTVSKLQCEIHLPCKKQKLTRFGDSRPIYQYSKNHSDTKKRQIDTIAKIHLNLFFIFSAVRNRSDIKP